MRTTMASRCGIIRWRTFSATSRCRNWSLTIWWRSCILRATTTSLSLSCRLRNAAWRAVMQWGMDAVEKNHTWELADLPRGHSAIILKWVFKLKRDESGAIVKHKTRLVARSFVQREEIDFDDTFAPVARMESV
jgi:hypothetical protein